MKNKTALFLKLLDKPGILERLSLVELTPLPEEKMRVPKQTKRSKKYMKRGGA